MGGLVVGVAGWFATAFLTLVFAVRMNLDGPAMIRGLQRLGGEEAEREYALLLERLRQTWNAFLLGQLRLAMMVGLIVWLGTLLLGVRGALLLGLLAGVLEVLPGIGPTLATIPAIIIALTQGSTTLPLAKPLFALLVAAFYVAVQQVENAYLVPRVMGQALNLPPLVVMVAVVLGVKIGGLLGAFVAAPCVASLKVLAEYFLAKARGDRPFAQTILDRPDSPARDTAEDVTRDQPDRRRSANPAQGPAPRTTRRASGP